MNDCAEAWTSRSATRTAETSAKQFVEASRVEMDDFEQASGGRLGSR